MSHNEWENALSKTLMQKLGTLDARLVIGFSVIFSEVLTSVMSLILEGRVRNEYLITGGVVSLIVSAIVVYLLSQVSRFADDIEILQKEIMARKQAEASLMESEEKFRLFMEYSPVYVFFKDENLRAIHLSRNFEKMLGRPIHELLGKTIYEFLPPEMAKTTAEDDLRILCEGYPIEVEEEYNGRSYITLKFPIIIEGKPRFLAGFTMDVTDRKEMEKERTLLINGLQEALKRVKLLSGLLPICSSCKKIRDDKGNWIQIETYIHDHSEAEFAHSICQNCTKSHYPFFHNEILNKKIT